MKSSPKSNRNLISQVLATSLSFGLFAYFGFHLMHGDMGYFALRGVEQKLTETQAHYDRLSGERQALETRVKLLRPGSLSRDMLDERAREVLGFAAPADRVILQN
jgi:cell division protein FtsB